jgi:uncharacterized protein (TIGR02271 family)
MDNRELGNVNADLRRLNELDDFDVAEGYPDIRGWEVKTPTGQKLGKVKDLIVSVAEMRVRYLDVEVAHDMRGPADDTNGHALLPIGTVELDDKNDDVLMSMAGEDFASYPRYAGGEIPHQYEGSLRDRFSGGASTRGSIGASGNAGASGNTSGNTSGNSSGNSSGGNSSASTGAGSGMSGAAALGAAGSSALDATPGTQAFYAHDHFEDQKAYASRRPARTAEGEQRITLHEEQLNIGTEQRQAGDVEMRKSVETEHVRETVPLRHDEVRLERRPITDANLAANAQIGGDQEIRVPLMREEAIVQKQAVPREELIIRRRIVTENRTVEADVRRERLNVDGADNVSGDVGGDIDRTSR